MNTRFHAILLLSAFFFGVPECARTLLAQDCPEPAAYLLTRNADGSATKAFYQQLIPDPNNPPLKPKYYKTMRTFAGVSGFKTSVTMDDGSTTESNEGFWEDGYEDRFNADTGLVTSWFWGPMHYEWQGGNSTNTTPARLICDGSRDPGGNGWEITRTEVSSGPPATTNTFGITGFLDDMGPWDITVPCAIPQSESTNTTQYLLTKAGQCTNGTDLVTHNYRREITPTLDILSYRTTSTVTLPNASGPIQEEYNYTNEYRLSDEFTTEELVHRTHAMATNFPSYWMGGQLGAKYQLDNTEVSCSISRMEYKFAVPNTDPDKHYLVEWDEVTRSCTNLATCPDLLSLPSRTRKMTERIRGVGGDTEGQIHEAQLPLSEGITTVENISVAEVAASDDGSNGGAPGGGGFGSPGGVGAGCATCRGGTGGRGGGAPGGNYFGGHFFSISLGYGGNGENLGSILLTPPLPQSAGHSNATNYNVSNRMVGYSMRSDDHPYVTVLRDPLYRIYSIVTPQGRIGITNISTSEFTITISPIQPAAGGEIIVWRVFNPSADSSRISIQKEVNQQVLCVYEYQFTGQSTVYPAANAWQKDDRARWTLTVGLLRQEEVILENFGTNSERHEVTIVRDPAILSPNVVFTAERLIKRFSWGEAVTKVTIGSNWVTEFQYASDASFGLSWIGAGSRKPLLRTIWPDGSWEVYGEYDGEGRPTRKFESAGDLEAPNPAADPYFYNDPAVQDALRLTCRTLDYTYGLQGPFTNLAATVEEQLYGQTVRKRTRMSEQEAGSGDYLCTEADYAGPSSTEQTTYRARGGRIVRVDHADGTTTLLSVGPPVSTVTHGRTNAANSLIEDGVKTEVWYNYAGQEIARTNFDLTSGTATVVSFAVWSDEDGYLRPRRVDYPGGDYATRTFACCGVETATDRDGVNTQFGYDGLGRRTNSIRLGIQTATLFNPMNNVRSVVVTGTTNAPLTAWYGYYDIAGLLYQESNALDSTPSFHDWTYTNGCLFSTNTFPNGGNEITTYYKDGSAKRVTGSGVAPVRYTHGVADIELDPGFTQSCAWTEERKLTSTGADTTEWTRTYFDWRGRPVQIVQGDTPANAVTRLRYNSQGQLWKQTDPDGVTTLLVYNDKGELTRTALAVDGGATPNLAGRDRVQETVSSVTAAHGTTVHRTETKVWTRENDPNPTSAAVVETAVDGKTRWVTSFGRTTTTAVGTLTSGVRTVTTTYPDNSQLLRTFAGGRLTSALRRTAANGSTIKSLTYGYDGLGRLSTIADARDGVTTIAQDLSTRSVTITTPAPATGQAAQVTTHTFGPMGLLASTRLPDNSLTQTEYFLTGLPKKAYGSHTYPADYTFDAQGRLKTMVTWQDYAGTTGQATNTWNYNQRGFLQSRTFHGGVAGPSYTYTPGGRLKTRTSARNIVTTYSYGFENAATYGLSDDLVQMSYANDPVATPAVNLAYDRVGRLKTGGLAGGMTSTLLYSDADGLLSETFSGGALNGMMVTNVFDALGRRATNGVFYSGQWQAQSAYTYDNASRLATASLPLANVSATYSRDIANSPLLSALTFREGDTTRLAVTPSYDLLDRLTSVQSAPVGAGETLIKTAYAYDILNQRTGLTNADNSFWTFGYDSKGQVQSGKRYWSDQTPVAGQQFEYQFDDIGNRKQMKSGGDAQGLNLRTTSYTLKPNRLNQFDTRTLPGFVDVQGEATNAASVNVNGQMAGRKRSYYRVEMALTNTSAAAWLGITNVAVLNQGGTNPDIIATNIGSLFVSGSPESSTYDADGNLTGDGRWSYTWDAENRLVKMESLACAPAGSKRRLTFEYDWRWRRVRLGASTWTNNTWSVTVSNKFAYDGWNLLAEFNATNNTVIRSYLWGNDLSGTLRGAGGAGGLLAVHDRVTINGQPSTHFTCFDGNGNIVGLVNAADGKVSARYEYGPFGELLRATGPMEKANPFRFSTKYQDDETGFLYYGFRYYRADLGRWLNQDPIGEAGGLNLYGFVGNSPLGGIDILGLRMPRNREEVGQSIEMLQNLLRAQVAALKGGDASQADVIGDAIQLTLAELDLAARNGAGCTCDGPLRLSAWTPDQKLEMESEESIQGPYNTDVSGPPLTSVEAMYQFNPSTARLAPPVVIGIQDLSVDYGEAASLAIGPGSLPRLGKGLLQLGRNGLEAAISRLQQIAQARAKACAAEGTALREGSFSIADWSGYPANVPKPTGPFRLLEGAEYDAARAEANAANRAVHQADPSLNGLQLHEIQPVKFGGSPTDPLNKIPLTPQQHAPLTTWWNQLQRDITP